MKMFRRIEDELQAVRANNGFEKQLKKKWKQTSASEKARIQKVVKELHERGGIVSPYNFIGI